MKLAVGIDFGTTNSAVAVADGAGVRVAHFPFMESMVETFRSVLFYENDGDRGHVKRPLAGPSAIERYLEPHDGGRLIQSMKSFAASRSFEHTQIGGKLRTLDELIGIFLKIMRAQTEEQFGPLGDRAVVGRPVRFVGDDEALALTRLREAYKIAGFTDIQFEYEPIGAAYSYAEQLTTNELVLIGDFGGGTSDFSIIELSPRSQEHRIIATSGAPIGGDIFDARIVRNLVSPMLGLGTTYRSLDKLLPVPASIFIKFESWHHLSFLRSKENIRLIQSIRSQATEPEKWDRLIEIVQNDLGYHLHRSVQRTKVDLSAHEQTTFSFRDASVEIERQVKRSQFEKWIAGDLQKITECVNDLLIRTSMPDERIDRVFLTGGSSLIPSVRRIFEQRFGSDKIAAGNEFTSVARGLALRLR